MKPEQPFMINIAQIPDPIWQSDLLSELPQDEIHLYLIRISDYLESHVYFRSLLNPEELLRAGRYHYQKDRLRMITSRAVQRIILSRYLKMPPSHLIFETGPHNKPKLQGTSDWLHYNISHAEEYILMALSIEPVGVDIEYINSDFKFREVLDGNFNELEINSIHRENPIDRFFELWTRKEAYFKATGLGVNDGFARLMSLEGIHSVDLSQLNVNPVSNLHSFCPADHYVASVASSGNLAGYQFLAGF